MYGSCGATTGCAAAVDNKDLVFMTVGPSLRIEDCWEGMGSTSPNGTKWAIRLANLLGNNFNIGTRGEGVGNPPSSEEVLDQVGKERVQCDVDRRDIVINKTGLKGVNLKRMHID